MSQNKRDDFPFGSRAWNEHFHGRNKDGHRKKADRAERAKKVMTKAKGKRAEESAKDDLREDMEKATRAESAALARVLPDDQTHAIKISPASGHVSARDVEAFERQGWTVLPAGTTAAKVGAAMGAIEAVEVVPNPTAGPLGPTGEARAVVLWSPEPFTPELVKAWRMAGYDVSAAAKAYRERREAKANPSPDDGERWKAEAKEYRENARRLKAQAKALKQAPALKRDRLKILKLESAAADLLRYAQEREAWAKEPATRPNPTTKSPAGVAQGKLYAILKRASGEPRSVEELADRAGLAPDEALGALQRLASMGLAHPASESLFGPLWAPGTQPKGLFDVNPGSRTEKGQTVPRGATPENGGPQAGPMATTTRKTPARKAPKVAKKNPAPPSTLGQDLESVWEKWTGAKASRAFEINLPGTHDVPASVVLLGKVSKLITAAGKLKDFKDRGPLMVTDGDMKNVWLLHATGQKFDLDMSKGIICYLAKKPKFGDREPVEYVHQFTKAAHARMAGPVGTLTGTFRLTGRGIEG